MKNASDFRSIARDALKGRWGIAVLAGLIATLLGAVSSGGPEVTLNMGDTGTSLNLEFANQQIFSTADGWMPKMNAFLIGGAMYIIIIAIVMAVVLFVLGSVISLGYSRFNLDLIDRQKDPELGTLFGYFTHWKNAAAPDTVCRAVVFAVHHSWYHCLLQLCNDQLHPGRKSRDGRQ